MALSAKLLSFLFVLSLFVSQHALARSVFFSKVANVDNHNDVKEESTPQELTDKDNTVVTKQEQEPSFYTQTQNGYGLYGHDSTEFHPSTTNNNDEKYKYTTTSDEALTASERRPYTTTTTNDNNNNNENNNIPYTYYNPKKNSLYYNGHNNNYETNQYGMSDTRLTQQRGGYTAPTTTQSSSGHSNSYFNVERQGMSDTRFMENGKYYYDPNSELENNNYNTNQYKDSRVVNSRNWYNNNNNNNNKGYYGNRINNKGYYGSNNGNQNTYESNDVYQNEEFQENEDDKFVP